MAYICSITPPHLLQAIADSNEVDHDHRECARTTLDFHLSLMTRRKDLIALLTQPRGLARSQQQDHRPSIVPGHLFQAILDSPDADDETKECARRDLDHIDHVHAAVISAQQGDKEGEGSQKTLATAAATDEKADKFYCAVYNANNSADERKLPGTKMRVQGEPPVKDESANHAFDNCHKTLEFYKKFFGWNSIDNKNMHVVSSVHFGVKYENAFWDPSKLQMVYGDGGSFLNKFAECIDVICHEMTHAITEHTAPLDYQGQSGALNEHISDVFGIMCKQYVEQETADKADWLIGEGCLMPGVKGVSLRSMKAPGTAYNDKRFGKDPQPDHMKGFKVTTQDNGGVHIFSGIPNKAFYNASVAFGGFSYEKAGQIWWATMNSGRVPPKCNFTQFADVTVDVAEEKYGAQAAKIVRKAWDDVGVIRKNHSL